MIGLILNVYFLLSMFLCNPICVYVDFVYNLI